MRLQDFETLIRRQTGEIPAEFLDGVADIEVSAKTLADPDREGVWTLGECIPIPGDDGDPHHLQSRIVLYHGSFLALARGNPAFDWTLEAWETLTHEVRHHVEWKARVPDLEALDRAAEANFARQDGQPFDPAFYRDGVPLGADRYQVDDDVFLEFRLPEPPLSLRFRWDTTDYEADMPGGLTLPAYLTVTGVARKALPGDLVLVLQRKGGWLRLFQRPAIDSRVVHAKPVLT